MNISKLCTKQILNLTLFKNIYCNKKIIIHHSNILKPYSVHSKTVLNNEENCSKYTNRTHTCGTLRSTNIGEKVVLCGWLEYQRMNKFIVLRDSYGRIQLLIKEEDLRTQKVLETIPFESILEVSGTVLSRPAEMINKNQPTGEIEVVINDFKVLNKAEESLPFNIREFQKAKEPLRMQFRYLDLRFSEMQRNLRYRSTLLMKMREFLCNNDFVDVETPTLFKATPGGAQEFVVPTRFPGQFYSLVQSPQQFKQMLMAGAVDRYFQIARCYRDEGARSDRQPEFTQLDIEMSFTNAEAVIKLIEDLLQYSITEELNLKKIEIQKMTYNEAMEEYGTDQPDLTFGYKLGNCTDILKKNVNLVDHDDFGAYFLSFPKELSILNKKVKESIENISNKFNNVKLVLNIIKNKEEWINKIGKLLTKEIATEFLNVNNISEESTLFLAFGNKHEARSLMGKIRTEYINFLESTGINVRRQELQFLWIIDFPLFELSEEGTIKSAHHPFTAPHPDDVNLLGSDPLKVRGLSYDLVLNGYEVGGGSIRIHDPNLQLTVLDILKINPNTMQHMLDMLGSGCPPHGGIALGLDRLLSVLLNTPSIRDVIAFPKNYEGRDPMSGAPSYISDDDKKLYHIRSIDKDKM